MSDLRAGLLARMIALYGENHKLVSQFREACLAYTEETTRGYWDNCLEMIVEAHEKDPYRGF